MVDESKVAETPASAKSKEGTSKKKKEEKVEVPPPAQVSCLASQLAYRESQASSSELVFNVFEFTNIFS